MSQMTRKDLGTWDTSVGLFLGFVLLLVQLPLGFTGLPTLLLCLGALTLIFSAFLLRAAWGRKLPLAFLNAPPAAWSVFWLLVGPMHFIELATYAVIAVATLLVLSLAKLYPQWCQR